MVSKIILVCTQNRAEGIRRAITLLQSNPVQDKAVVLKPNFNSADRALGSTHIDTLRTLVLVLQEIGAARITLAERSGPGDSTRQVMEKKGIFDLAKELGFDIVNLEELGPEGWVHIRPKDSYWQDGFLFPKVYTDAESIVQTCCLKTHAYGGHFTLSLKNSVGMVPRVGYPYMGELHSSPYPRQLIAEINTAYSPDLVVLDGVDAFVLVEAAKRSGWIPKPPFTTILKVIGGQYSDESSALIVGTKFLYELFKQTILAQQRDQLILAVLDTITSKRNHGVVVSKLKRVVERRFYLIPLSLRQVLSVVEAWERIHIN